MAVLGSRTRQSGAVLATGLIFLLVMTILGVTALQTTQMEQKMAVNAQVINDAFQIAESGLEASNKDTAWNTDTTAYQPQPSYINSHYKYAYQRNFRGFYSLLRTKSQAYSSLRFRRAQYEVFSKADVEDADGETVSSASVYDGTYLIVPKPGVN